MDGIYLTFTTFFCHNIFLHSARITFLTILIYFAGVIYILLNDLIILFITLFYCSCYNLFKMPCYLIIFTVYCRIHHISFDLVFFIATIPNGRFADTLAYWDFILGLVIKIIIRLSIIFLYFNFIINSFINFI